MFVQGTMTDLPCARNDGGSTKQRTLLIVLFVSVGVKGLIS